MRLGNERQLADARGGPAWAGHLRAGASKMIVVATDDNARLSAIDFESFAGGKDPFNSTTLPPAFSSRAFWQFDIRAECRRPGRLCE